MNRRSFIKLLGAGAGSMATFSLSGVGLSKVVKYGQGVSQEEAQAVLEDIADYGKSNLVSRVATSQWEKRILIGLEHHLGKEVHLVNIDENQGHVHGKAYIPTGEMRSRWALCNFYFHASRPQMKNFDFCMFVTEDAAKNIMSYRQHLDADPALFKVAKTTTILPVF